MKELIPHLAEPVSLETPVGEDGETELGDLVEDRGAESPFESAARAMLPAEIEKLLAVLDERERYILTLRFGLDRGEPRTPDEVGQLVNLSRERVRQIEARALARLRHPSVEMGAAGAARRLSHAFALVSRPDPVAGAARSRGAPASRGTPAGARRARWCGAAPPPLRSRAPRRSAGAAPPGGPAGRSANAARGARAFAAVVSRSPRVSSSTRDLVGNLGPRLDRHARPDARLVGGEVADDPQQVPLGPLGVPQLDARGQRPHHRGLREVLGVGVVAAERPGVAEDLDPVLDHHLAEVDGALGSRRRSRVARRLRPIRAPPSLDLRPVVEGTKRTFRPARLAMGSTLPSVSVARVLVTRQLPDGGLDPLAAAGHEVVQRPGDEPLTPSGAARRRRRRRRGGVRPHRPHRRRGPRAGAPRLRVVANVAVGYDNVDVAAAAELGIAVCNTPGVLDETTADLAFLLILAAARRASDAEADLRQGRWTGFRIDDFLGVDVHGAHPRVVGYGRIGQAVARRAAGFGMEVLHHTRHDTGITGWVADLDDLLSRVRRRQRCTCRSPTRRARLIDARRLALMKPRAVLVNTARGPVVDEEALAVALESGAIFAAGIDVFEREPEVHPRLLAAPHAVLLPHIGSATRGHARGAWPSSRARAWSPCSPAATLRTWSP